MRLPGSSVSTRVRCDSYEPFPSVTAKAISKIRVLYLSFSHINQSDITHMLAGSDARTCARNKNATFLSTPVRSGVRVRLDWLQATAISERHFPRARNKQTFNT